MLIGLQLIIVSALRYLNNVIYAVTGEWIEDQQLFSVSNAVNDSNESYSNHKLSLEIDESTQGEELRIDSPTVPTQRVHVNYIIQSVVAMAVSAYLLKGSTLYGVVKVNSYASTPKSSIGVIRLHFHLIISWP